MLSIFYDVILLNWCTCVRVGRGVGVSKLYVLIREPYTFTESLPYGWLVTLLVKLIANVLLLKCGLM